MDVEDEQGNIVCISPVGNWLIISRDDERFCDGVPDCTNGEDEDPGHCIALAPVDDIYQNALMIPSKVNSGYLKVLKGRFNGV